jgi:streptogramin lyase
VLLRTRIARPCVLAFGSGSEALDPPYFGEDFLRQLESALSFPVEAPDGSIRWAGQWANLIGQIIPATGAMKEYPLPPNAMPHTVVLDGAGNVSYTGNKNGTVGELDPKTGKVTAYRIPDPAAKDPHTAVFDQSGTLWFTLQISNMVDRLNPATGAIKLVTMKTPGVPPTGSRSTRRASLGSLATAPTAWSKSTRFRWNSPSISCRTG